MDTEIKNIETQASNIEEAITKGLALLGVSADQVRVEVLDEGSRGLLGLGSRDATVRLTLLSPSPDKFDSADLAEETIESIEQKTPAEPEPLPKDEPAPVQISSSTVACEVLSELLHLMGVRAQVRVRQDEDTPDGDDAPPFVLDILGNDLGVLIGRRGQTLHALQFMTRLLVSREVGEWVGLVVDVEKYKVRRAKQLQQLADRLAERVVITQQPVALEPMPPHERRVIHVTLREHPIITTESVGSGDRRKVTILPKN